MNEMMTLRFAIDHYRERLEALRKGEGIPERDRKRIDKANMQGHYKMIQTYLDHADEVMPTIKCGRDMDLVKVLIQAAEMRLVIAFYNPYIMRDEERLLVVQRKGRAPRFSARLVVSEIKAHLKPANCDELLQHWRDGINEFGDHGIECEFADGKYQAYVTNDESRFYSPSKTWGWSERTITDNW